MKKIFLIVLIIFSLTAIALLAAINNYVAINELKDETANNISLLNRTDSNLINRNELLETRTAILEKQQQSLMQEEYDFLVYKTDKILKNDSSSSTYHVKSGSNVSDIFVSANFAEALNYAFDEGNVIMLTSGNYNLNSDIIIEDKSNLIFDGHSSVLNMNGFSISFVSDNYAYNSNNLIQNLIVINGTFILENSFKATLQNMIFEDCTSAIEVSNTNTWSEGTKVENVYWGNCQSALTFKTPVNNGTASYENTALDRCFINLHSNESVGIVIEENAQVSNGQWTNMRIWMDALDNETQTGMLLEGVMSQTVLSGVIFESFGNGTIYGIYLGNNSDTGFSIGEGTIFLGNFNNPLKNDFNKWIYGTSSVFKEELKLTKINKTITFHRDPLTINSFEAYVNIENLTQNDEIILEVKLNFIDQTHASIILNSTNMDFSDDGTYWLTNQNYYHLYPSQNIIKNIEVTLYTDIRTEDVVKFGLFGTLT